MAERPVCSIHSHHGALSQHGYVLLEMLIAAAIAGALLSVLLRFTLAVHATVAVQGDVADLQQRLRVAVESVRRDLLLAGAGPSRGAGRGPLARVLPPIVPARLGSVAADPELSFFDDRITLVYVPQTPAQTTIVAGMVDAASPLVIDGNAPGCPPGRACEFAAGDRALVFEPGGAGSPHETFTVAAADTVGNMLTPSTPLSRAYPAGSRVVAVVQRVYYFDRAGKRLMVYDGARSDVPIVDHVVDLRFSYLADPRPDAIPPPAIGAVSCVYAGSPPVALLTNLGGLAPKRLTDAQLTDGPVCGAVWNRFDADLLRIRRVVFTIRLEAESAEFRGTGSGFSTPGFSRSGTRYVPDVQATIDVAPRNMATSW
jgi:type II secretory pathway pseudopilin PulG